MSDSGSSQLPAGLPIAGLCHASDPTKNKWSERLEDKDKAKAKAEAQAVLAAVENNSLCPPAPTGKAPPSKPAEKESASMRSVTAPAVAPPSKPVTDSEYDMFKALMNQWRSGGKMEEASFQELVTVVVKMMGTKLYGKEQHAVVHEGVPLRSCVMDFLYLCVGKRVGQLLKETEERYCGPDETPFPTAVREAIRELPFKLETSLGGCSLFKLRQFWGNCLCFSPIEDKSFSVKSLAKGLFEYGYKLVSEKSGLVHVEKAPSKPVSVSAPEESEEIVIVSTSSQRSENLQNAVTSGSVIDLTMDAPDAVTDVDDVPEQPDVVMAPDADVAEPVSTPAVKSEAASAVAAAPAPVEASAVAPAPVVASAAAVVGEKRKASAASATTLSKKSKSNEAKEALQEYKDAAKEVEEVLKLVESPKAEIAAVMVFYDNNAAFRREATKVFKKIFNADVRENQSLQSTRVLNAALCMMGDHDRQIRITRPKFNAKMAREWQCDHLEHNPEFLKKCLACLPDFKILPMPSNSFTEKATEWLKVHRNCEDFIKRVESVFDVPGISKKRVRDYVKARNAAVLPLMLNYVITRYTDKDERHSVFGF